MSESKPKKPDVIGDAGGSTPKPPKEPPLPRPGRGAEIIKNPYEEPDLPRSGHAPEAPPDF